MTNDTTGNFHKQQTTFIKRQLSSIDIFHQYITFINRNLSAKDNFRQQKTFINRQLSSIENFRLQTTFINRQHSSSLTRVTSVKSLEGIFTYQSHISQVSRRHPQSPESHQSSLQKTSSLTRVASVKSSSSIISHQGHISQVNANVQSVSQSVSK